MDAKIGDREISRFASTLARYGEAQATGLVGGFSDLLGPAGQAIFEYLDK